MSDRTVFEKLAETLPEEERRELLDKINRSMGFGDGIDEAIYEKQMTGDEREELIRQDLERLSLLSRFVLWLKSVISGKSRKDLFVNAKIKALKGAVNRKCPGLTGFETRDLSGKFAEAVFDVYKMTLPLLPIYRQLVVRSKEMEGAFLRLLEERYPETSLGLSDVVSFESLEQIYEEKGQEQAVRRATLVKFDELARHFDDRIFEDIEKEIVPVFYLKDIVFFPYAPFFELFHVSLAGLLPDQVPEFKTASAMLAVEYLERLHLALYNASKVPASLRIYTGIAHYLLGLQREAGGSDNENPERSAGFTAHETDWELEGAESLSAAQGEPIPRYARSALAESDAESSDAVDAIVADFANLFEEVRRFDRRMPVVELIRYFLKDPYHRLYVYVPRLRLRDYYLAVMKVRLLAELEEVTPSLRKSVVTHKIERLFRGQRLVEFLNYREYRSADYEQMGLPFFSRTWSLNLVYNFIHWYYREFIEELVKILGTIILVQNRVSRNKLLQHATIVEDLEQKIRVFDEDLSADSEEGRVFHRLRASLAGDPAHQRAFRTIVLQKDVYVNGLVERARESLAALQRVFEEVYLTPSESVRERLASRFYMNGRLQPLSRLLKDRAEYIREFLSILLQVMRLEGV